VSTTEEALAALNQKFVATWQIWFVPHFLDGGVTWCARRWDGDYRHNLHAYEPGHLADYIAEADESPDSAAGHSGS
jgi:hypothetical protein